MIKSRHWKLDKEQNNSSNLPPPPPPGNYRLHNKNCVTCLRMEDGKTEYQSAKTGRTYKIRRHYTCQNQTHLVYLVRCGFCNANYVGQTIQTMRKRHLGHRAEIRAGSDGLGRHFKELGVGLNLKNEEVFESQIMKHFELTMIGSVEPGKSYSQNNLDRLEGKMQQQLMTMD